MMRIAFVRPDNQYRSKAAVAGYGPMAPYGLMMITAAVLPLGHELRAFDVNLLGVDVVLRRLEEFNPDIIALHSILTDHSFDDVATIHLRFPDAKLVVGGPLATVIPEFFLDEGADFVVVGEGAEAFYRLMQHLHGGQAKLEDVPNLVYRQDGETRRSMKQGVFAPLGAINSVFDLFNLEEYASRWCGGKGALLVSSFGCPYNCPFCSAMYLGPYTESDLSVVRSDLEAYQRMGVKYLYVGDAILPKSRILELCDTLRPFGFSWICETRPETIGAEQAEAMAKAGASMVVMGLESVGSSISAETRGNKSKEDVARAIAQLRDVGIQPAVFVLFGLPGETRESIRKTLDFVSAMRVRVFPNILFPIPGTPIWEVAQHNGRIPPMKEYLRRLYNYYGHERALVATNVCGLPDEVLGAAVHAIWEHNKILV